MKKTLLAIFTTLILIGVACTEKKDAEVTETSDAFSLDSAKIAIANSNKTYGECFASKDSVSFLNHYTKDACLFVSNMPRLCGPQAINGFFNGSVAMGIGAIDLVTEELIGDEKGLTEIGNYQLKDIKGNTIDKGKFIVVWKQEDGKWKMYRDIFNSDNSPAPSK
ncbi:MAG: DUF4440 domain-containing protein [Sediminibacterium sp.]|nr:DUF4440 domain-containing protein [Sediminibacterium sp.]TXT32526.1 MAG: hypothetical protein FD136_1303 [Chitinophagaceae bacterium]